LRREGSPSSTKPRIETSASSSGNSEKNAYIRFQTAIGLARLVSRPRHIDEADVVRLGLLLSGERERACHAEQRRDADILLRGDRHTAGNDRRCNSRKVLPLDSLRGVLGGRMGDFVPQYRGQRGVVPGHREDAGVDHDLAAREAVGVRLVLAQ
jgi:hypothetical protein